MEYDDDPDRSEMLELQEMLGQTYALLRSAGDPEAALLVYAVDDLRIEVVGYEHDAVDNWPVSVHGAILDVESALLPRFTEELRERIWARLRYVLLRHNRRHVNAFDVQETLPDVGPDWRDRALDELTTDRPTNQARRERQATGFPSYDGMTFGSDEEIEVYKILVRLQQATMENRTFSILPLPTAKLRATALRSPDLVVVGNSRALVIEVDGPHHRATHRVVDDQERDRSWRRCGVETYRIPVEHLQAPKQLEELIKEEVRRRLWPSH